MRLLRTFACAGFIACATLRLAAAINPEEFKRVASDVVKLREIARVMQPDDERKPTRQRITIVGEILEVERTTLRRDQVRIVVIDYTIDVVARAAAQKAHAEKSGNMPGPQFMHEPDAPAQKEFWAHLAPLGGRLGNVNRHAGAVIEMKRENFSGPVFVPVAGQYSWDAPAGRTAAEAANPLERPVTYTGTVRTGVMAVGGETTGMILETERAGTFELEVKGDRAAAQRLEALNGRQATIAGTVETRPGVEIKERRILVVRSIR